MHEKQKLDGFDLVEQLQLKILEQKFEEIEGCADSDAEDIDAKYFWVLKQYSKSWIINI